MNILVHVFKTIFLKLQGEKFLSFKTFYMPSQYLTKMLHTVLTEYNFKSY